MTESHLSYCTIYDPCGVCDCWAETQADHLRQAMAEVRRLEARVAEFRRLDRALAKLADEWERDAKARRDVNDNYLTDYLEGTGDTLEGCASKLRAAVES